MRNSVSRTIFLSPVSADESLLYKRINTLKPNKAPALDGITSKLFKSTNHDKVLDLVHIFNSVFQTGTNPDALKVAKVIHEGRF